MPRGHLVGALLAALVVFVWSAVSHMFIPWHEATLNTFSNEADVAAAMMAGSDGDGIYILPYADAGDEAAYQAATERMKLGPVAFVALRRGGVSPMSPHLFIWQFVFQFIVALILARLLACIGDIPYSVKLRLIVMIAVLAGVMVHLPQMLWWGFGGAYTAVNMIDLIVGWLLGGLVLLRFAR